MRIAFPLATAAIMAAGLTAQSPLNTINPFLSNNAGGNGGVVWFNLSAWVDDIEVTAFDINCNVATGGAPITVTTLINPNGYVGNTTDPSGWTNIGDSAAIAADNDLPTNVVLSRPICIPALTTVGIGLILDSGAAGFGHAYTNGNGTNQNFNNAELAFAGGQGANSPFDPPFSPRVANVNIYYNVGPCMQTAAADLVGTAETTPGTGTLVSGDSFFRSGDTLRWNFVDPFGSNAGQFAVVGLNFGGPPATSASIPGLTLRWAGSTPAGTAFLLPPNSVGAADYSFLTPSGPFFSPGNTVRIQGIVLDPAFATGTFPVVPTATTITYTHTDCFVAEGFDSTPSGTGSYPVGWASGGGIREWTVDAGGTSSSNTGPTGATTGANYLYCETSSPSALNDTYIVNTDVYSSAGLSTLDFDLSRIGATTGTLEVRMGDGTGTFPTLLGTYTGPDPGQAQNAVEWSAESLPLGIAPANVQFQFHYVRGTSFTGDLAIDSICLK